MSHAKAQRNRKERKGREPRRSALSVKEIWHEYWATLQKAWPARKPGPIAPVEEFLEWVGGDIENTHENDFDLLPGLVERGLESMGGRYHHRGYRWTFEFRKSGEFWKRLQRFHGSAGTRREAAVTALIVCFEMVTMRKLEGDLVLR